MWRNSLFLLLAVPLLGGSVTVINDSKFPLIAEIYNNAGDQRGSVRLLPGQTYMWYDNDSSFGKQYDSPTTPYTVNFLCPKGRPYDYGQPPPRQKDSKQKTPKKPTYQAEFGSWINVPTGATINALGSTNGPMSCVISSKSKQAKAPPSKAYKNEGFQNWSNDGGETWINNNGPGWENNDLNLDD